MARSSDEQGKAGICLVFLPDTEAPQDLYAQAIKPTLRTKEYEAWTSKGAPAMGLASLFEAIEKSSVVVCADASRLSAAAFFEIGFARAIGKLIIVLAPEGAAIPPQLVQLPILRFTHDPIGYKKLRAELHKVFGALAEFPQLLSPPSRYANRMALRLDEAEATLNKSHHAESAGESKEAYRLASQALVSLSGDGTEQLQSRVFLRLATLCLKSGETTKGLLLSHRSADEFQVNEDINGLVAAFSNVAAAYSQLGDLELAKAVIVSLKSLSYRAESSMLATLQNELGSILLAQGDYAAALSEYAAALSYLQKGDTRDPAIAATILANMAVAHLNGGSTEEAQHLFDEALQNFEKTEDRAGIARVLHNLGILDERMNRREQAMSRFKRSLELKEALGDKLGRAATLSSMGSILASEGKVAEAAEALSEAIEIETELHDRIGLSRTLSTLSSMMESWGRKDEAAKALREALLIAESVKLRSAIEYRSRLAALANDSRGGIAA